MIQHIRFATSAVLLAASAGFSVASAQFAVTTRAPFKPATTTSGSSGGWLVGTDDCNQVHRAIPSGDQFGVPFTTGTTGTEGQNEANCYFFGSTAIDNDVWWDWTSTASGNARILTCGGTTVDTKIALWPGSSGCPADGTSIACNDDACGLQTSLLWPVSSGTTYTIQLGTFPGGAGGSGSFDVSVPAAPPFCGTYDDGTTEGAVGPVAGGETGWLHYVDCLERIDRVETAYSTPGGVSPPNGSFSAIAVYEDSDCDEDPTTGPPVLRWSLATAVTNAGTDLLESHPTGGVLISSRCSWVMATARYASGEFPAPMDTTNPTPRAWVVGQTPTGAMLDLNDLNGSSTGLLQMQAIGFPTAWLLRASGSETPPPPRLTCSGITGCPCNNDGDGAGGCENSALMGGATLLGSGTPSLSSDTFVLAASRTPNQPGIFFQGDIELLPPVPFGDGFRCCGNDVVRLGTYAPSGNATDTATGNLVGGFGPPISTNPGNAGLMPGDLRCYQWWFRDPQGPCGSGFNLSNALRVVWAP